MKRTLITSLSLVALLAVTAIMTSAQLRLPRPSHKATVTQTIGVTDVTITYFDGITGQQLKQFLVSSAAQHVLEENEVYQLNNIFADPAIPANVPALVVRIEAVSDGPYVSAYVVQLDNTSQDGSFFVLEEE